MQITHPLPQLVSTYLSKEKRSVRTQGVEAPTPISFLPLALASVAVPPLQLLHSPRSLHSHPTPELGTHSSPK